MTKRPDSTHFKPDKPLPVALVKARLNEITREESL